MFDVAIDRNRHLMTIRVSGFWDAGTFRTYAAATAAKAKELHRGGGFAALLIDMSDYPLQAKEIADRHGVLLTGAKQHYGCRVALVMRSALSRLQATRVAKLTGSELYDSIEAAMTALAAGPPTAGFVARPFDQTLPA